MRAICKARGRSKN